MTFIPDQPSGCIDQANQALRVNVVAGGGAGGGGPVTVADGADIAQGATTDAAVITNTTGTLSAKLRGLVAILADIWDSVNHRIKVDGSGVTQPVSGTFFQATQPVSAATLPIPSGAALDSSLTTLDTDLKATQPRSITNFPSGFVANAGTNLNTSALALEAGGNLATIATNTAGVAKDSSLTTLDTDLKATQPRDVTDRAARLLGHVSVDSVPVTAVTGAFFQATQPISAASLPLPANAAQETSGNLDALVALNKSILQLLDLQREQLAVLKAIQVQHANAYGDIVDSSQFVGDVSIQ